MTSWQKELRDHLLHTELKSLRAALRKEEKFEDDETDDLLARLRLVIERAIKVLAGSDEIYVSTSAMDLLLGNVNSFRANFNNIRSARESPETFEPFRSEISSHIGTFLQTLGSIPPVAGAISEKTAQEKFGLIKLDFDAEVAEMKEAYEKTAAEIRKELEEAKEKADEVTELVSDEKLRVDNLITQFQSEFSDSQKQHETSFKKQMDKDFAPKVKSAVESVHSDFLAIEQKANAKIDSVDEATKRLVETLEGHIKKAGLSAQSITQKLLRTEYEKEAATEKAHAENWAKVTLGVAVIMALFVGGMLIKTLLEERPFSPETILPKVLLTAVLIGVARWTAKLEKRHAQAATRYKNLSLELETLAPFIATLPEPDQQAITKDLVPSYFKGRQLDGVASVRADDDADAFQSPLEVIKETISRKTSGD